MGTRPSPVLFHYTGFNPFDPYTCLSFSFPLLRQTDPGTSHRGDVEDEDGEMMCL